MLKQLLALLFVSSTLAIGEIGEKKEETRIVRCTLLRPDGTIEVVEHYENQIFNLDIYAQCEIVRSKQDEILPPHEGNQPQQRRNPLQQGRNLYQQGSRIGPASQRSMIGDEEIISSQERRIPTHQGGNQRQQVRNLYQQGSRPGPDEIIPSQQRMIREETISSQGQRRNPLHQVRNQQQPGSRIRSRVVTEHEEWENVQIKYDISKNGRCGKDFMMMCPENNCCSEWGWCGDTDGHCDKGCQLGFGRCNKKY